MYSFRLIVASAFFVIRSPGTYPPVSQGREKIPPLTGAAAQSAQDSRPGA